MKPFHFAISNGCRGNILCPDDVQKKINTLLHTPFSCQHARPQHAILFLDHNIIPYHTSCFVHSESNKGPRDSVEMVWFHQGIFFVDLMGHNIRWLALGAVTRARTSCDKRFAQFKSNFCNNENRLEGDRWCPLGLDHPTNCRSVCSMLKGTMVHTWPFTFKQSDGQNWWILVARHFCSKPKVSHIFFSS